MTTKKSNGNGKCNDNDRGKSKCCRARSANCGDRSFLVGAGGGFAGFYFLEEPDDDYAEETEE
jgi:hypothetical protein